MINIYYKNVLESLYVYILFFLLCYNDFISGVIFGALASSPVLFLVPFFAILEVYYIIKYRKIEYSKMDIYIISFLIFSIFISIFYIFFFMLLRGTDSFQNASYFFRFTSYLITISALFITYRHSKYIFINFKPMNIYFGIFAITLTQILILIIEIMTMPNAFSFLHFVYPAPYFGIRLLAYEASVSAFIVPVLIAIALYYSNFVRKSKISSFICISFFVFYSIVTTSKGFLLSNFLTIGLFLFVLFFFYKNKTRNFIIIFLVICFIPIFLIYFYPIFIEKMTSENQALTFSTRFLDTISGVFGLIDYPLGHGFGVHQEALLELYSSNSNKLNFILGSNIDISEISRFSYDNRGLDNKSLFSFALNISGIFALYLMYQILKFFLTKNFVSHIQLYLFLYVVLSLTFFISFNGNYLLAVYIAFLEINVFIPKQNNV
ncbi:hypothetical protein GCL60_09440 [Silvanigrella paludirubra]|uniref:O-antigen ligase domain-containing protein n=1 Tax=Silvanigrella paludirubra TaxID=2499159 RepID=A0A6N6VSI8_9BACT|nr:O-antigen polymerase [Silvanigrella paludirubra]KAB8039067.1 hypothetical protein GCL60_09440 [Silvanigrella paludirubra]